MSYVFGVAAEDTAKTERVARPRQNSPRYQATDFAAHDLEFWAASGRNYAHASKLT